MARSRSAEQAAVSFGFFPRAVAPGRVVLVVAPDRLVLKVAPPFGTIASGKWKALCVCNPNEQVGVLESFSGIPNLGITCTVPTFNAQGDYVIGSACYDWTPVTK